MTAPTDATPPPERTTVLVVDDEDGIRQALTRFLTRLGYQVRAAANASEALEHVGADHPQAMLCDIRMPGTSGVELLPKVLAQDPDLAVIMLTAIEEIALDALAAARDWSGTDAALSKLAEELGAPREELAAELKRRRS